MTIWHGNNLKELRRRYDLNETFATISAGMGVSRSSIAGAVARMGFPPRDLRTRERFYKKRAKVQKEQNHLPRYVIVRPAPPEPKHEMTKREIEADFANIWANTARL